MRKSRSATGCYGNNNVGLNEIEVYKGTGASRGTDIALHHPIIDGSGSYNGAFNINGFVAQNVTDGSTADNYGQNYWLGRDGVINEYFTLDLGTPTAINEIDLRNTHNDAYNDRGTKGFQIFASNSIDASHHLVKPVQILTGSLSNVTSKSPIPPDIFTGANGLTVNGASFRYLEFKAISSTYANNSVGLNEIEMY